MKIEIEISEEAVNAALKEQIEKSLKSRLNKLLFEGEK
jgi:hypothetical protein